MHRFEIKSVDSNNTHFFINRSFALRIEHQKYFVCLNCYKVQPRESDSMLCIMPSTELKMTEWKTTVDISSSSQSSIAALKNVLADGRLTSSPPLSPPHTLFRASQPPLCPIPIPIGAVCGWARGCGEGEGEQSSSISHFLGNSGALSVVKQIVHKSSSL